jgi:hypothetical protein
MDDGAWDTSGEYGGKTLDLVRGESRTASSAIGKEAGARVCHAETRSGRWTETEVGAMSASVTEGADMTLELYRRMEG